MTRVCVRSLAIPAAIQKGSPYKLEPVMGLLSQPHDTLKKRYSSPPYLSLASEQSKDTAKAHAAGPATAYE
eukprot:917741-Pyramimonas_sp.AAC.1